jgi:hypothetical protein
MRVPSAGFALFLSIAAAPALAADPTPSLEGTYGFDWLHIKSSRCVKIEGSLLEKLRTKYQCGPADAGSASGQKIATRCKSKDGKSEYMLFASTAACKEERALL